MGKRTKDSGIDGVLVIDKAPGMTSHDVVARCRRLIGQQRCGHSGTLDPDATGVMLVGFGRGTKLLSYLTALGKTYTAEVVLGTSTSTLDDSGTVLATYDMSGVTIDQVRRAAATFVGEIDQLPPMSFAVFPVGELPPGRYLIGISCTLFHVTADYWDAEIVISADPDDSPGQMGWRLASAPDVAVRTDDGSPASRGPIIAIAAAVAISAIGVVGYRRRHSRALPSPRSKESQ